MRTGSRSTLRCGVGAVALLVLTAGCGSSSSPDASAGSGSGTSAAPSAAAPAASSAAPSSAAPSDAAGASAAPSADSSGSAAGATSCDEVKSSYAGLQGKTFNVGSSPGPASYDAPDPKNPDNIIGIEPDLMHAAAACAGFTVKYVKTDFNGLIPAMQAGRIDLISAGMYASDERAQKISFVQYMKAGEASIVRKGNPKKVASMDDTCGLTAAEAVGTVENAIFDKQSAACKAAGKKPITAQSYSGNDQAMNAVAQGRSDIFLTDAGVASYLADKFDTVQVGFPIPSDFVFGFGVSKKNQDLRDGLLNAMKVLSANGEIKKTMDKWGFSSDLAVEPSTKG